MLSAVFRKGLGMCIRRSGKAFASLWPDLCHEQVSRICGEYVRLCLISVASTHLCVGDTLSFVPAFCCGARWEGASSTERVVCAMQA